MLFLRSLKYNLEKGRQKALWLRGRRTRSMRKQHTLHARLTGREPRQLVNCILIQKVFIKLIALQKGFVDSMLRVAEIKQNY